MKVTKRVTFLILMIAFFISCRDEIKTDKKATAYAPGTKEGYDLAKYYCANCHQFVPPSALDQITWKDHVLPSMGVQLGINVLWDKEYVDGGGESSLPFKDWMKIVDFYIKSSPDNLIIPPSAAITTDTSLFSIKQPRIKSSEPVKTTMTVVDTATKILYTSDALTEAIYRWDNKLQLIDSIKLFSPAVHALFYNDGYGKRQATVTAIGTIKAIDSENGKILHFELGKKFAKPLDSIAFKLSRPVESIQADFDNDGLTDWLVCSFGKSRGGLYWYKKNALGYQKNIIEDLPGAVQAVAEDFNNDGWTDCMVLFAHDEESLRLYINNKNGSFTATRLLNFLPVNGSTSFQLIDFNKDGLKDILYTCGDNADVSKIFKPFHGVYIYLNKGNNKYEKTWFYHINGCSKAVAADFDKDGDLDIATIAFYADFQKNPLEKFIYFNNIGQLKFKPLTPPLNSYGRWLTMDVNDYDGDGDEDIILGNFAKGFFVEEDFKPDWDLFTPFTVLENKTYQK